MKKVTVLMSTYNGEKYLREQLDSVFAQEGVDVCLVVRDDGSSDATLDILEEYSENRGNMSFYQGENLRSAKSFIALVKDSPESDYYAFCDQDDVWDSDKLISAVELLENEDESKPNMYFSNLNIVDQDLNFIRASHSSSMDRKDRYIALAEPAATGCTVVFNKTARDFIRKDPPKYCSMHDTWLHLVCNFFGKVIYDPKAHISYRQHGGNVVGTYREKSLRSYTNKFISKISDKDHARYRNAISFYNCYKNVLPADDRQKLLKIIRYDRSLKDRLSLLTDRSIHTSSSAAELVYRLRIIMGTL